MSGYVVKVYVVQKALPSGLLVGPVIAVKLTFAEAHQIAKDHAPAKVSCIIADKTPNPNNPDYLAAVQNLPARN